MKAADIMAAATPGPWSDVEGGIRYYVSSPDGVGDVADGVFTYDDARAIVTAVNLFPLYEAVRKYAKDDAITVHYYIHPAVLWTECDDGQCVARRAALDALQAAEDAL